MVPSVYFLSLIYQIDQLCFSSYVCVRVFVRVCVYLLQCEVGVLLGEEVVHGNDPQRPLAVLVLVLGRRKGELPPRPVSLREREREREEEEMRTSTCLSPSFTVVSKSETDSVVPGRRVLGTVCSGNTGRFCPLAPCGC